MIAQFRRFLNNGNVVPNSRVSYYLNWVSQLYQYLDREADQRVTSKEVESFLKKIALSRQDWQVRQAREAIRLYLYMRERKVHHQKGAVSEFDNRWKAAVNQMVKALRLKKRALTTERSYLGWVRDFCRYHNSSDPHELTGQQIIDYLSYLAVDRNDHFR